MLRLFPVIFLFSLIVSACSYTHFVNQKGQFVQVNDKQTADSVLTAGLIHSYKKQIDTEMNTVICQSNIGLTKAQPESTMGNWISDAVAQKASEYSGKTVDFSTLNYGGMRVLSMPQGNITKGNIFEVMPFDNLLVIVEMKGSELADVFNNIAVNGGWPVSAGIQMTIKDKVATDITVGGKAIEPDRIYRIALSDYLANGGDKCSFFVGKPRIETGKFLRDAIIEYCLDLQKSGKNIDAKIEGRIR